MNVSQIGFQPHNRIMIRSIVSSSSVLVRAMRAVPSTSARPNILSGVHIASASSHLTAIRHFSGNVEYPRIEGTVLEVSQNLNNIGNRLSTATAALYLTKQKIEYVVSKTKTVEELKEVQKVLLLCDAKYAFPSEFAASSFISACIRLEAPEIALDYVRNAKHVRHYLRNRSFVRLATHYVMTDLQPAIIDELVQIMQDRGVDCTHKMYTFRIMNAKKQNKYDEAVQIAKEAAANQQINSYLIMQLLKGFEGTLLEEQKPLAHYLISKGNVYPNEKLKTLLAVK